MLLNSTDFILLTFGLIAVGIFTAAVIFFFRSSTAWKHERLVLGKGTETAIPSQVTARLQDLNIPKPKLEEAARRISSLVNEEVSKQSQIIHVEMDKAIDAKNKTIKSVQEKYETVQSDYQKLGKQKKQTESAIQSMAKGLIVLNDDGEVVFVNPVAESILGVKSTQLIGKSISNVDGEHVISLVDEEGQIHYESKKKEAKEIIKESTAVIQGISGQTKGIVSILTGVTQEKKVDEYKTEFLANITHELRTPLVCIQKAIEAILEQMPDVSDQQKNYFNIAIRNTQRLESTINEILDVSKMEAGKMVLHCDIIPLKAFVEETKTLFTLWAKDKNIKIHAKLEAEAIVFEADPERIRQVLGNLISNALKFTPKGGEITIDAKIESKKMPGLQEPVEFIRIGVRDTGPGISEANQKLIFKKFALGHDIGTAGEKGTGLGLSLAKEIVELHQGHLWLESEEGKGCYFIFSIPKRLLNGQIQTSPLTAS